MLRPVSAHLTPTHSLLPLSAGHMGCWDEVCVKAKGGKNTQHILSPALIGSVATAKGKETEEKTGVGDHGAQSSVGRKRAFPCPASKSAKSFPPSRVRRKGKWVGGRRATTDRM